VTFVDASLAVALEVSMLQTPISMKRKLLVTGAQGFVAGSVLAQAGPEWEIHAVSRGAPPEATGPFAWHCCDALNPSQLEHLFWQIQPDALIHTAAIADIDVAEQSHDLARKVNVGMTSTLVDLCYENGCRMVHCSTDTVFDGEHAPYSEEDAPKPVNFYGRTKVEAEQLVAPLGPLGVIARLAIVLGLPVMGAGNSFLTRMIQSLREGKGVVVPVQEARTPVDVITAGRALLELAAGGHTGIFHVAGNERLDRMDMAQRIVARLNLDSTLLKPQTPADLAGRAPRPRDVSLNNERTRAMLRTPMLDFDDALSLVLRKG
jgi:dTDP-4-dehydrorhamnose reductase